MALLPTDEGPGDAGFVDVGREGFFGGGVDFFGDLSFATIYPTTERGIDARAPVMSCLPKGRPEK